MKTEYEKYCSNCGQVIDINAEICPKCGVRQFTSPYNRYNSSTVNDDPTISDKDWLTTIVLCAFLGCFGIHRFYTNNTMIGIIQLITLGGCGIWMLVDIILLALGSFKDGDGRYVKNK
ncbi:MULTISPECIES: TM2 domain-containing protein [unclassified Dysgonomonas]|uniref:TM2 domain-containing protein n=1 Tax=unclassified Dysgonomonas TaxID=2630389 RepID=UPI001C86C62C|nr:MULTISPECIES: NINE protein [unclassified Dysgonomonas]